MTTFKALAMIAATVAVAAGGAMYAATPLTPEQIEQQRIQTEKENAKQAETAERERVRQSYLRSEEEFGSLLMLHTNNYRGMREQAKKNGMITTDGLMEKRDAAAMAWFKANNFRIEKWEVSIIKVDGPDKDYCPKGMTPCINLNVKMTTPFGVVLHASTPQISQFVTMLTASQPGDVLVISGRFVQRYANNIVRNGERQMDLMPKTPKDMEVSLFESGSMDDPEYRIVIDSMASKGS
jgi:hypothetical protein